MHNKEPTLKNENNHHSSKLKILEEGSQYVNSTKVRITILKTGSIEEHEVNLTTKNLGENSYYSDYSFSLSFSKG